MYYLTVLYYRILPSILANCMIWFKFRKWWARHEKTLQELNWRSMKGLLFLDYLHQNQLSSNLKLFVLQGFSHHIWPVILLINDSMRFVNEIPILLCFPESSIAALTSWRYCSNVPITYNCATYLFFHHNPSEHMWDDLLFFCLMSCHFITHTPSGHPPADHSIHRSSKGDCWEWEGESLCSNSEPIKIYLICFWNWCELFCCS